MIRIAAAVLATATVAVTAPAATAQQTSADCGQPATLISEVQGSGSSTPMYGETVAVEAVVSGVFPDLSAITLMEEEEDRDGSDLTSEGIFVYARNLDGVEVGDQVRLTGRASEWYGKTQLSYRSHVPCDTDVDVDPVDLRLPLDTDAREAYEGMAVTIADELYVSNLYVAARYGQIGLSTGDMLRTSTEVAEPGEAANEVEARNEASTIILDDASNRQNPLPGPWFRDERSADPATPVQDDDPVIRGGDTVEDLTGVIDYSYGEYKLLATAPVEFESENGRTEFPEELDGDATIGAFNVLNYFTTIDADGAKCGPLVDQGCRGADNAQELADQRSKIIEAISRLDADVLGLVELENAPDDAPLADLVDGLNEATAPGTYAYVPTGPVGSDAIRVGLIYQPAEAQPVGDFAVLDSSVDTRFNDDKNRAVLAQSFLLDGTETVTVAVNHLKSKGSSCGSLGDPNTGDGQGNCNLTRTAAAEAEADWLASDPTGVGDTDTIVIGDLNAYTMEDPVRAFLDAGFVDAIAAEVDAEAAYTYVYDGRYGRLDHALVSPSLADKLEGATVWHINSPEVNALTYDTRYEPFVAPGQFASSDHDPVLISIEIDDED